MKKKSFELTILQTMTLVATLGIILTIFLHYWP